MPWAPSRRCSIASSFERRPPLHGLARRLRVSLRFDLKRARASLQARCSCMRSLRFVPQSGPPPVGKSRKNGRKAARRSAESWRVSQTYRASAARCGAPPRPRGRGCAARTQRRRRRCVQAARCAVSGVAARHRPSHADDAEAEDVAQETLLRLWRSADLVTIGPGGLQPWLRRVASNLCIDRIRTARREMVTDEVPEQALAPEQLRSLEEQELGLRVDLALKALPERQAALAHALPLRGDAASSRSPRSWGYRTRPWNRCWREPAAR